MVPQFSFWVIKIIDTYEFKSFLLSIMIYIPYLSEWKYLRRRK